jgi:hypothetical protein
MKEMKEIYEQKEKLKQKQRRIQAFIIAMHTPDADRRGISLRPLFDFLYFDIKFT